jgi:hypothetical protein
MKILVHPSTTVLRYSAREEGIRASGGVRVRNESKMADLDFLKF